MFPNQTEQLTIGIDLGDHVSHYCVIDDPGLVVEEGQNANVSRKRAPLGLWFPAARMVVEAGTHPALMGRPLKNLGHKVIVEDAREIASYGERTRIIDGTPNAWPAMVGLILRCSPRLRIEARIFG